jgi:hypothetical protein
MTFHEVSFAHYNIAIPLHSVTASNSKGRTKLELIGGRFTRLFGTQAHETEG